MRFRVSLPIEEDTPGSYHEDVPRLLTDELTLCRTERFHVEQMLQFRKTPAILAGMTAISIRILLLSLFAFVSCSSKPGSQELVVGMDLSYPPFETIDEEWQASGDQRPVGSSLGREL